MAAQRGFTLVELFLVIAITAVLALAVYPVSVTFLRSQTLDETASALTAALRRAELQAMFGKDDRAFGVKVLSGSYVLFEGDAYASRETGADLVTDVPSSVSMSGIDEVVFEKGSGTPQTTGTITVSAGNGERTITINDAGSIE